MPYRAFDGGLSVQAVPDDYKPTGDERIFKHLPSDDELAKAFKGFGGVLAVRKAREEARLTLEAALFAGCQIASKAAPSLDGTYSLRPADMMHMVAIAAEMTLVGDLPGGGDTFTYPDQGGSPHAFNRTNFTNFYGAMMDYLYALKMGEKPTQPVMIP